MLYSDKQCKKTLKQHISTDNLFWASAMTLCFIGCNTSGAQVWDKFLSNFINQKILNVFTFGWLLTSLY